jgi:hypothetical protein
MSASQVKAAGNDASAPLGMVVPKHGRGLLKPIQPGEKRNPGGKGGLWQETQRFCREKSVEAARRLFELLGSDDERVSLMAADKLLTWGWGKPPDYDPNQERPATKIDLSDLSLAERRHLLSILDRVTTVMDVAPPDAHAIEGRTHVVDAVASPSPKQSPNAGRKAQPKR